MKKKLTVILTIVIMIITMIPGLAFADDFQFEEAKYIDLNNPEQGIITSACIKNTDTKVITFSYTINGVPQYEDTVTISPNDQKTIFSLTDLYFQEHL